MDMPDVPLRLTQAEWDNLWDGQLGVDPQYTFPRGSVSLSACWCGDWDYQPVFRVTVRGKRPRTFGPHLSEGLAQRKTREFLIAEKVIELVWQATTATEGRGLEIVGRQTA